MDTDVIETVSTALVREYLSRKGFQESLTAFEAESPRCSSSITNRSQLCKELHITKLMKLNKEYENPLRAMLEVIVRFLLQNNIAALLHDKKTDEDEASKSTEKTTSADEYQKRIRDNMSLFNKKNKSNDLVLEESPDGESFSGAGMLGVMTKPAEEQSAPPRGEVERVTPKAKTRGLSGPITSSIDDKHRHYKRPIHSRHGHKYDTESGSILQNEGIITKGDILHRDKGSDSNAMDAKVPKEQLQPDSIVDVLEVTDEKPAVKRQSSSSRRSRDSDNVLVEHMKGMGRPSKQHEDVVEGSYDVNSSSIASKVDSVSRGSSASSVTSQSASSVTSQPKTSGRKVEELEFGDLDDDDHDIADIDLKMTSQSHQPVNQAINSQFQPTSNIESQPIDAITAVELRKLIFGPSSQLFNDEWKYQSFCFCDLPKLQYGIVQKKGGSCGVLAAIQACVLRELLFKDEEKSSLKSLFPNDRKRSDCLARAISSCLWKAGNEKTAVVTVPTGRAQFMLITKFKPDDITETLVLNTISDYSDLNEFVKHHINQFENDDRPGVVLLLYSIILSRSIAKIRTDMDEPSNTLIGAHGYCTQELVNLILIGRASSNAFDNTIKLDSGDGQFTELKGVMARSDIGLLSLFEHYKSCEVGKFLKTPRYPIWVVCSESHFSVLFSLRKELISDWKAERKFDLYYYDGLGRQDEEVKLTIDTTSRSFRAPDDDTLVPPLELCIRTKWTDAEIHWNGTEALL